jgi:hypothetical protein
VAVYRSLVRLHLPMSAQQQLGGPDGFPVIYLVDNRIAVSGRLNDRINQLLRENEELAKRKEWTEDKLAEVANGQGQNCVDLMVEFCR